MIFKQPKVQNHSKIKIDNTLCFPTLLFENEDWTTKAKGESRITAAEVKLIGRTANLLERTLKKTKTYQRTKNRTYRTKF
jgi:hypothetical protein